MSTIIHVVMDIYDLGDSRFDREYFYEMLESDKIGVVIDRIEEKNVRMVDLANQLWDYDSDLFYELGFKWCDWCEEVPLHDESDLSMDGPIYCASCSYTLCGYCAKYDEEGDEYYCPSCVETVVENREEEKEEKEEKDGCPHMTKLPF